MRYTKGKWVTSYRDTYSLEHTLNPIIGSALVKFKEVITTKGFKGLPVEWISDHIEKGTVTDQSSEGYQELSDSDWNLLESLWMEMLDKCIFAFNANEPDMDDYDFKLEHKLKDQDEDGYYELDITCTNEDEKDLYTNDLKDYHNKCQEGRELFGKYLHQMWW